MLNWWRPNRLGDPHTLDEEQHGNPYRELCLLSGHRAPVQRVEALSCSRFISLSKDCTASIWNSEDGSHVLDLEGHSVPIVAVLFFGRSKAEDSQAVKAEEVVVTGSSDGIKVWSLLALQCGGEERTAIQPRVQMDGAVTCLEKVGQSMFCSGGESLCLWNCSTFELLCKLDRKVNVKGMLVLPNDHYWSVVALSDYIPSNSFDVWDIIHGTGSQDTQQAGDGGATSKQQAPSSQGGRDGSLTISHASTVTYHTGVISIVCNVSDKLFATVSPLAPAQVVIWSKFTITMVMKIDQLDSPKPSPKHPHTASVDSKRLISCVVPFNEKYLLVAMDNNFTIYDIKEKSQKDMMKPVMVTEIQQAHSHPINSACLTGNGHFLVTCADDGRIRLWGTSTSVDYEVQGCLFQTVSQPSAATGRRSARRQGLSLIGDLQWGHTQVKGVCSVTDHSFVSFGSLENEMILWKNHEFESKRREEELAKYLMDHGKISLDI